MIKLAKDPVGSIEALSVAISHLLYRDPHMWPPLGGGQQALEAHASSPLTTYSVRLDAIKNTAFFKDAEPTGWRYVIHGSGPVAVADLHRSEAGKPVFSRLIRGPFAESLAAMAEAVSRAYAGEPEEYEARLLEIPALYMWALWLHGPKDVFFQIPRSVSEDADIKPSNSFLTDTVSSAASFKKFGPASEEGMAP